MRFVTSAAVLLLLVALVSQVHADTIYVQNLGVSPGLMVTGVYDADGAGSGSGVTATMMVGQYNWKPIVNNNCAPFDKNFQAFCIDIDQSDLDSGPFTIKSLEDSPITDTPGAAGSSNGKMSHQQAEWLRELWGENYASLCMGTIAEQQVKNTAFQLAIWEILFERSSTKNLSNGYFKILYSGGTPAHVTLANDYLASTYDTGFSAYQSGLVALTNHNGQDQITIVPVPPAFMGGMALMGLIAVRKSGAASRWLRRS